MRACCHGNRLPCFFWPWSAHGLATKKLFDAACPGWGAHVHCAHRRYAHNDWFIGVAIIIAIVVVAVVIVVLRVPWRCWPPAPPHSTEKLVAAYGGEYKNLVRFEGDHNHFRPKFFYDSVTMFFHQQVRRGHIAARPVFTGPLGPVSRIRNQPSVWIDPFQHSSMSFHLLANHSPPPRPPIAPSQFRMDEQLPGHADYIMNYEIINGGRGVAWRGRRSVGQGTDVGDVAATGAEAGGFDRANGIVNEPWRVGGFAGCLLLPLGLLGAA